MSVTHRILRQLALLAFTLPALAATPITGTVTNKTTGKPSGGDDVTLVRLAQGMQDSTHTRTDSHGHYKLEVPDDGLHLVRVTHDKANYFQPAQPGTTTVDLVVYNAAEHVEGVSTSVQELHIEATATELHIVEVLQVLNRSQPARTQFGPEGYDFYLPTDATIVRAGAVTENGMPVQTSAVPVGDPGHFKFLFPLRPGETQFGIIYSLPYKSSLKLSPKLASPVATFAVVVPKSIKIVGGQSTPYALTPGANPATDTYMAQNVSPSQPLDFTISGIGELPRDADKGASGSPGRPSSSSDAPVPATDNKMPGKGLDNPLDPEGTRDPWGKYKWWILTGLAFLLAAAAGILLRKPAATDLTARLEPAHPTAPQAPADPHKRLLETLKEELFALETDRLQNRISEEDYLQHKSAIELILRRALGRSAA